MGKTEYIAIIVIFNIIFLLFIAAIITYMVQYKTKKKEHTITLNNQKVQHQQELLATQLEMQEQTMQHIGREIHDNVGQKLTLASLYTQQLAYENKAPQVNEAIENISQIINQSLSELRELSKSLTNTTIDNIPIENLLEMECKKINDLGKCKVYFIKPIEPTQLTYQVKSVLFRISQEFIQNSIKHAHCKTISLFLERTDTLLRLILKDDGIGFDIKTLQSNGIGLENMKKRTEIINGTHQLQSDSSGTQLIIEIPLQQ